MVPLLRKEFRLCKHPITPMMVLLSAMVLIPNYPYVVIFFYVSMAIFFTCLLGRENNDIIYSLNLPIRKRSIVKARLLFAVIIQLVQLAVMIPFSLLNQHRDAPCNQAGMDATVSLFAIGFLVYGLFNRVFFSSYYRNVNRVGVAFVKASVVLFACAGLDVVSTYAVPFVRERLDTPGASFLWEKLIFFALCALIYGILTVVTYQISIRRFERQDLN